MGGKESPMGSEDIILRKTETHTPLFFTKMADFGGFFGQKPIKPHKKTLKHSKRVFFSFKNWERSAKAHE